MMTPEQIIAAHKAHLTTIQKMTETSMAALEKIGKLNVTASKTALENHAEHAQTLLGTKDFKELAKLNNKVLHEVAEKFVDYNHTVLGLASSLGADLSQIMESRVSEAQAHFVQTVELAMQNLPQGAEPLADAVKAAINSATEAIAGVKEAVKKAAESNQSGLMEASDNTVKVVRSAKAKTARTTA